MMLLNIKWEYEVRLRGSVQDFQAGSKSSSWLTFSKKMAGNPVHPFWKFVTCFFFSDSTTIRVSSASPVPSNSSSPVLSGEHTCDPTGLGGHPTGDVSPHSPHHRSKHRTPTQQEQLAGWTGCKECAKSDQSSDEVQYMVMYECSVWMNRIETSSNANLIIY